MVTFINRLTVRGDVAQFEQVMRDLNNYMAAQPGFLGRQCYRSRREPNVFVETVQWADPADHAKAVATDGFRAHVRELAAVAVPEHDLYDAVVEPVAA